MGLLLAVGGCAKIGPGVRGGAESHGLGDVPSVVLVAVSGLRSVDLEATHPDGGPMLPALSESARSATRWFDGLPAGSGAAGLWSLLGGEDPRRALDPQRVDVAPLAPGWTTDVVALPPRLASQPEARTGVLAEASVLDTDRALESLERHRASPRRWGTFVLDPWPPAIGGAPIVADRRLQPRVERLRRLDAPLAAALGRLARSGATVVLTGLLPAPGPAGTLECNPPRERDDLRVPLIVWSTSRAFEPGVRDATVHHRDLRPTLHRLARGEREGLALLDPPTGARRCFWWSDEIGGAWWEVGERAARADELGFHAFDLRRRDGMRWTEPVRDPVRIDALRAEALADLDVDDGPWTLWVKGSDQLDLVELEIEFDGEMVEAEGAALEDIDEVRRAGPRSASAYLAAEPEGDLVRVRAADPLATLHVRAEGRFHPQPIFGAPFFVGPQARSLGLNELRIGALSRTFWMARGDTVESATANGTEKPEGVHVLRTPSRR